MHHSTELSSAPALLRRQCHALTCLWPLMDCTPLQAKTSELKQSLNKEFRLIHELCLFVLNASQKADLVRATLATLAAYLTWVPLGYVLESNIVELLLKLFPPAPTRNLALQCLTEVCACLCLPGLACMHDRGIRFCAVARAATLSPCRLTTPQSLVLPCNDGVL